MAHSHSAAGRHAGALRTAIGIGLAILAIEVVAGILANSLALLADAAHVFADVSGMTLSLVAIRVAGRPPSDTRTYGLYRLEMLAAAVNAVLLLLIAAVVAVLAVRRFVEPPDVLPGIVTVVAAIGLGANLLSLRILSPGQRESLFCISWRPSWRFFRLLSEFVRVSRPMNLTFVPPAGEAARGLLRRRPVRRRRCAMRTMTTLTPRNLQADPGRPPVVPWHAENR